MGLVAREGLHFFTVFPIENQVVVSVACSVNDDFIPDVGLRNRLLLTADLQYCVIFCTLADASCNFESSACDWSATRRIFHRDGSLDGDLLWRRHRRQISPIGPVWDRSSTDGSRCCFMSEQIPHVIVV